MAHLTKEHTYVLPVITRIISIYTTSCHLSLKLHAGQLPYAHICLQKSLFPAQGACPTFVDFAVDISRRSELSKLWLSTLKLAMQICPFFVATSLQFVVLIFNMTILRFFPKDPPRLCECLTIPDKLGLHFSRISTISGTTGVPWGDLGVKIKSSLLGLWDVTSGLVDVTSGLVDVTSGLVDVDLWACGCDLVLLLFGGWFHPLSKKGNKMTMDQNSTWSSIIWSHTPADYHTLLLLHVLNIPPTSRW